MGIAKLRVAALLLLALAAVMVVATSATARKTIKVRDAVTLGFNPPKSYGGNVTGFKPARFAGVCAAGRKVILNHRDAPDQSVTLIGTDRTDPSGVWVVEAQTRLHGQIQAAVKARVVHSHGKRIRCAETHTPFIDV